MEHPHHQQFSRISELAAAADGDAPTTLENFPGNDDAPLQQGKAVIVDEPTDDGAGPCASDHPPFDDTAKHSRPQAPPSGHQAALLLTAVDGTVCGVPEPSPASLAASQMGAAPTSDDEAPPHPGQVAAHNKIADPDDDVPEERLELVIPPGRMGIVLVSPDDPGPCYVFVIREDSPLWGKARLGDRVEAINGVDVSDLSSSNVSKLLGSRASEERRITVTRDVDARPPPQRMAPPPSANEPESPTPFDGEATRTLPVAVQALDTQLLPWWKTHRKVLIGTSLSVVAGGLAVAMLSRDGRPETFQPSILNFAYYADQQNELCSDDPLWQPDGTPEGAAVVGHDSPVVIFSPHGFETVEDCCEESFPLLRYNECIMNSYEMYPSSSPSASRAPLNQPSYLPSNTPTTSLHPILQPSITFSPSSAPSNVPSGTLPPTLRPTTSLRPTSSSGPSSSSFPSMSPATRLQSTALRFVTSDDILGHSGAENVAIQCNTAVIGAPNNDNERGAVYVMERNESNWSQLAKLEAPNGERWDLFGRSVAIDGNMIVVGANGDDRRKGSVHIFTKISDSCQHQARLVAPDRDAGGFFGHSVGIHQDRIVVGAPWEDCNGHHGAGAAYIFVRNETAWSLESKLLAPDGDAFDFFGRSVGIFGDKIAVGAPNEDTGATLSGATHIYSRTSGGLWEHQARLSAPDGAYGDGFGQSVGIHGNHVIIGAPWDDSNGNDAGASFIFYNEGSAWTLESRLLAPDGAANGYFGRSVGIFKGTAVVGSPRDDDNGWAAGSVHLFGHDQGAWSHRAELLAPDGTAGDYFGQSVAVNNGTIIAHSSGISGETFAFLE